MLFKLREDKNTGKIYCCFLNQSVSDRMQEKLKDPHKAPWETTDEQTMVELDGAESRKAHASGITKLLEVKHNKNSTMGETRDSQEYIDDKASESGICSCGSDKSGCWIF